MKFAGILTSIALVAALGQAPGSAAWAQDASTRAGDDAIVQMKDAFRKSDRKQLAALLPQVRGHALEPWAAYWELRARLVDASNDEVRAFLRKYAGTYQEDRLRNDWLLLLWQVWDWATFMAEYPGFRMNDDREVRCYALLTDFNATGADVAGQIEKLWLDQRDADEGCAHAADMLLKARKMKPEVAWQRARIGMENGRLAVVAQAVGLLNPDWTNKVKTIFASPERYLDEKHTALLPRTKELVTLGLIRMAAGDPAQAAEQMDKLRWRTQLTQEERSAIWGVIGKRAAQRLSGDANTYFANARDKYLTPEQLEWKVRAALRAGNWQQVIDTTAEMDEAQRQDPAWTYWRARALLTDGRPKSDSAQAAALFERIAGVSGFYEQLALEELGRAITLPAAPAPPTEQEKAEARQNPALQRSAYAIRIGLRSEGDREWNYAVRMHDAGGMDDRHLLAAADLACANADWKNCINTSERTRGLIDMAQRFPMPLHDAVIPRAQKIGLDPAYVYGLIRQESRFLMDARSGVGASGLMQVMPATARWTAKKIGMDDFKPSQLNDRGTNITIGTAYLKLALDDFDDSMPLAAAAYNAGPGRPRSWRNGPVVEAAIWAENIPFSETRDYVKKVLSNTTSYAALLTGKPQSLKARLGMVGPRAGNTPEVNKDLP
ncbi:MAG: transglycosylase SLT domain-containing protein [Burkholderiaceae bacterium]